MPKRYVVRQGDCIASIAFEHGFFPDTLWNSHENAELKETRKSPNVLAPGDEVVIPELRRRDETIAAGASHKFKRKGVPEKFRARLVLEGKPRKQLEYTFVVDGVTRTGKTDDDGKIEEWLPPNARSGRLRIQDGKRREDYELSFGTLDPPKSDSGCRARLRNLGFYKESEGDQALVNAIKRFQSAHHLLVTGELDEQTERELDKIYKI